MFKIRKNQMEALAAAARRDFEGRAVEHLFGRYADGAARLGEVAVRDFARRWIGRAEAIGMTEEMNIVTYLDATFGYLVGSGKEPDIS